MLFGPTFHLLPWMQRCVMVVEVVMDLGTVVAGVGRVVVVGREVEASSSSLVVVRFLLRSRLT
jgi:hypothetical protein